MQWGAVRAGQRVILSTGRVAHVLDRVPTLPGFVMLRNAHGRTASINVDPGALVPVLFDELDLAIASLAARFGRVEYLMDVTNR